MIENGLFVFRCARCDAMFCLLRRDEKYGDRERWRMLEANVCRVCGKGDVEFVGIVHYSEDTSRVP